MILLVLVAHDGKTLQLDVSASTRVDAVQQALAAVTGIAVAEQIVMCHGARLDPAKPLSAYKLPVADPAAAEDTPVFLYAKAYLRPGAAPPPAEPLPMLEVTVPGLPCVGLRHPLHAAHSPLIRALPDYEAQFTQHLGEAKAFCEASQARLHRCRQLMSEQEVQARAADAARANVESHYNYIASQYAAFVDKYVAQHQKHTALLAQFDELSAALEALPLPPQLVTASWRVLADLTPRARLAEWSSSCSRSHEQFGQKVMELEGVFQLLRCDVERLFLQAPRVDLDALGSQLGEAEASVEEQASIVQVLGKDLDTVRDLVESVVQQLGGSAGGASLSGAAVHDSCAAVDALLEQHINALLPRVRAADTCVAEFLLRCGEAKACMGCDVMEQLQGIAAQQSRIRDMKHKLALFNEVLSRQAAAFAELAAVTRLPAAYRLALAECARRAGWQEMYAAQAARLAEHCGRITAKEAAKREAVTRQLERVLPHELLARAGLLQEPPHCTVSLPPSDAFLLPVSPADLAALPAAIQAAADAAAARPASSSADAAARRGSSDGTSSAAAAAEAEGGASAGQAGAAAGARPAGHPPPSPRIAATTVLPGAGGMAASAWLPGAASVVAPSGAAAGGADPVLENARLRAELAALLAQAAAKELAEQQHDSGGSSAGAVGASQLVPGGSAAAGRGSISLAASSTAAAAAAPGAPAPAGQAATASEQARPSAWRFGHSGAPAVPDGVAAPLPSVSSALQAAERGRQAAAALAEREVLALAPVKAALAAKDELVAVLEGRVAALQAQTRSYGSRIAALEAQLAARPLPAAQQHPAADQSQSSHLTPPPPQQQQQLQLQQEPQQQQQQALEDAGPPAQQGLQSVAPAFVLDATQGGSFFRPPMPASHAAPAAAAAAAGPSAALTSPGCEAVLALTAAQLPAAVQPAPVPAQQQPPLPLPPAAPQQQEPQQEPPAPLQETRQQELAVPAQSQQGAPQEQQQQPAAPADQANCSTPPSAAAQLHEAAAAAPAGDVAEAAGAMPARGAAAEAPPAHAAAGRPQSLAAAQPSGEPGSVSNANSAALSVSEPDVRGALLVAAPQQVAAQQARLQHRASLDSAPRLESGAGGLSSLLSSSVHRFLFPRRSEGSSGASPPQASPPSSSPRAAGA